MKIFAYNHEQTLAWCGGFNASQFTMGDLNNDGLKDLIVFDNISLKTFINKGVIGDPNYIYAPQYESNFPPINDYLFLCDYNCDGIPDLFQQGITGFAVYTGYYNADNQLCFNFYKDLAYYVPSTGWVNIFNNPGDIPSIVDVDNDGDLDVLTYDVYGGTLNLYKNMQVELGLPCDSIDLEFSSFCWGKFHESYSPTFNLAYDCNNFLPGPGPVGNTICLFDYDMDGDYDYIGGNIVRNTMTFLLNGRIPNDITGIDSIISQDSTWQSSGKIIQMPAWPAAFSVDIDQDGKKDLLIAPSGYGENYKCIWYYQNLSTVGAPNWQFQSDTFLIDKTIDVGTAAYPLLFDYNKDGLPDLFIGSDGYYQDSSELLRSRISYYMNTSVPGSPSFTLQTKDFLNIDSFNFQGTAVAFGDIDNDGKADMILGHSDGTLSYFKNMALSDAVQPAWQLVQLKLTDIANDTINVGNNAAPFIYDIDKDNKKDLIIGEEEGYIRYYENVSTLPGNISLKLVNTRLGNAHVGNFSAPFIGKTDSTGVDYLLMSNGSGISQFDSVGYGGTVINYPLIDAQYSFIDTPGYYENFRTTITEGDITGDGSFYIILGKENGGVELYKQKPANLQVPSLTAASKNQIDIYPNPARNELTITSTDKITTVTIHNLLGQSVYSQNFNTQQAHLNISGLPPTLYFITVNGIAVRKFVKE